MPRTLGFSAHLCQFDGLSAQRTGAMTALLQVEPPGASRSTLALAPPKADVTASCVVRTRCSREEVVVSFVANSLEWKGGRTHLRC